MSGVRESWVPLTDGLASLENGDERLTKCACWSVSLGGYNPVILVVPYDTSLDEVEALARRATLERGISAEAASTMMVQKVERQYEVLLSPRLA